MEQLPMELLFVIAENITRASDLLSLGLTCKHLAAAILPTYLSYHTISAPLEQTGLWIHLFMNLGLCWYIRHLRITRDGVANPEKRLVPSYRAYKNHLYQRFKNEFPSLWPFKILGPVLCRMVNLQSFEWSYDKTPIFDTKSNIKNEFLNLRFLARVMDSQIPVLLSPNNSYVSIFDTPVINSNLVSLNLTFEGNALDCGNSIIKFLTTCLELKYLSLRFEHQAAIESLLPSCRWPNLQMLYLVSMCDYSLRRVTEESLKEFLAFHSKIVSLKWHIQSDTMRWLSIPPLPPKYLPCLRALDCDENFFESILSSRSVQHRPLEKITGFPSEKTFWDRETRTFRGISRFSLRIVAIPAESIIQLQKFLTLFPNVECIDTTGSTAYEIENKPDLWGPVVDTLSTSKRLRVILGMRLWGYDDIRKNQGNDELFRSIHVKIPRLEFCGTDKGDGIVFTREGDETVWHWTQAPPVAVSRFVGRERDFMIDAEYECFKLY